MSETMRDVYRGRIWQQADGRWVYATDASYDGGPFLEAARYAKASRSRRRAERRLARELASLRVRAEDRARAIASFREEAS